MTNGGAGARRVQLSSLERPVWRDPDVTKGDVVEYYGAVASALLPHVRDRAVTLARFPEGVDAYGWYQTNCRQHPAWVRTRRVGTQDYCRVDDLDALLWAVNIGTIELHPLLARGERTDVPAAIVFDLDPGPPAGIRECCEVALLVREELAARGLSAFPKTSGSLGVHVHVPLDGSQTYAETKPFARSVAAALAARRPELVVDRPSRELRRGKVLVDWAQNAETKSLVAPYSLRVAARPGGETPLVFDPQDVVERLAQEGDLFRPVVELTQSLEGS